MRWSREGYRRLLELNADVQMCGEAARCRARPISGSAHCGPISSYQVTKQLQAFASVTTLLDERYASLSALGQNFFNRPNDTFGSADPVNEPFVGAAARTGVSVLAPHPRNSAAAQHSSDQCDSIEPSLCGYVTMPHASGNSPICLIG